MTQIGPGTAFELIRRLVAAADQYKADVIVTVCPMCQMNLDAFQGQMNGYFHTNYKIPVLFFTQLMGIAFGDQPEKLGFGSEFVSARPAMAKIGVETPEMVAEAAQAAKPKRPSGLPMPPPLVKAVRNSVNKEATK
jgi:heterodisulfide reductase subunit B